MTTIEELRKQANEISESNTTTLPYTPSRLLYHAANEIEKLQLDNLMLQNQVTKLNAMVNELLSDKEKLVRSLIDLAVSNRKRT